MSSRNLPVPATRPTSIVELHPVQPDEKALQYIGRLMEMLPPPDEDVIDRIAAGILSAPSPMEENQLWDSTGSKDCVGKAFVAHSVHIQPTDYEEAPLPYFVIVKVTDLESGEKTILTSGSVNICTSLVKAQLMGSLPWQFEIVGPRRPSKAGRLPLHVRWVAKVVEVGEDDGGRGAE